MKRLIIFLFAAAAAVSCKVIDPYQPDQLNDDNIGIFCGNIFDEEVRDNLTYFYNAYNIARFLDADAEEKVSPKYDLIRTGLRSNDVGYSFDYDDYTFNEDPLFVTGSSWKVKCSYYKNIIIDVKDGNEWVVTSTEDGTVLKLKMTEETEDSMNLTIDVEGLRTEESPYSAKFSATDLAVTLRHENIGMIDSMIFGGEMTVRFLNGTTPVKECVMTMVPGMTTHYDIF
ncbi:MAG: hypothetical protein IJ394_00170 [Bacteroidales bacterium]|nr:hypothetical protein [Bacteroidales bacterium]